MTTAVVILALVNAGATVGTLLLALRNAGLREEKRLLEDQLVLVGRDFATYRKTGEAQLAAVRRKAKKLEDRIAKCSSPDDVRDALNELFSSTASRGDDRGRALPEPATAAAVATGDHVPRPDGD